MIPLVYQIIIGDLPEVLHKKVDSVKEFAKRKKYEYRCDTQIPDWAIRIGMEPRYASVWMRAEVLSSRPYVLYADWDIEIKKDIILDQNFFTIPVADALIYFGKNIDIAQKVFKEMGDRTEKLNKPAVMFNALESIIGLESIQKHSISTEYYKHLGYNSINTYWRQ